MYDICKNTNYDFKKNSFKEKDSRNVFYLVHLVLCKPIIFPSGETGLNVFFEQLDAWKCLRI